ncbi:fimbrial protein [Cronobacter turicensis]|uniref:fimbrial protein n=1 Tax=Cronobacter turicensis TaxID=413502 RepID=UPI0011ABEC1A|nr:fimbrial protein [Cronobacter turicensis]EKY3118313.1 fimbrial protein [Cronobacter turicensis]ELU8454030.1 fimbrial protein [Cronobacter turicensis]ELY4111421.1 fimbrial protein [Cronobacter turicensis]ELY4217787.1 fimbrial protein [Cronobacter turicensis]EMA1791462.1 fimbrial protein [Cronobacter turicensis]
MKTSFCIAQIATVIMMLKGLMVPVYASDCTLKQKTSNVTIPVTVQLPDNVSMMSVGSVLYKREASLAELSGKHDVISTECRAKISQLLRGKMPSRQSGQDTYATPLPGVGVRITLIYEKAGFAHKEWVLPFSTPTANLSDKTITSDDLKIRFEAIKTGPITGGGVLNFRVPSLVTLSDNSLVVNLALALISPKAHCMIQVASPQIELLPVKISELKNNTSTNAKPVGVNLLCINTSKASINIEGLNDATYPTVFKNVSTDNQASNVGIEMLFNGAVMRPGLPVELALPNQNSYTLPLTVRYAKTGENVTGGKVKAQITLRINYL